MIYRDTDELKAIYDDIALNIVEALFKLEESIAAYAAQNI